MIPALLLVGLSLLTMLSRVSGPFGEKAEGRPIAVFSLTLLERIRYHRTGLYCFGVILALVSLAGLVALPMQILAVVLCYAVLLIPVRYQCTSLGIGVNNIAFRRWDEFVDQTVKPRSLVLRGATGRRDFTVRLSGARQHAIAALAQSHGARSATGSRGTTRRSGSAPAPRSTAR